MTLERKTIRCTIAEALRGRTFADDRVFEQDHNPTIPDNLRPADGVTWAILLVYTLSDTRTRIAANTPRAYSRRLEVAVEVCGFLGSDEDATPLATLVDELCDQVECVVEPMIPQLLQVEVPGREPLGINPDLSGLERVEIGTDARGQELVGAARLVFAVEYVTSVDEREEANATDLERMRALYRFPPPDDAGGAPVAEDEIDLANP